MKDRSLPDLIFGPLQYVTKQNEHVFTAISETDESGSYALWHVIHDVPEDSPEMEEIFISRISEPLSGPHKVAEGADPNCLPTRTGGYISWIRKNFETNVWSINLSTFKKNLQIGSSIQVATEVPRIFSGSYLVQLEDGATGLVYLNISNNGRCVLHTYFLNSHEAVDQILPIQSPEDFIVKSSQNIVIAAFETKENIELFRLEGRTWKRLTAFGKGKHSYPFRFDLVLTNELIVFVMERNSNLETRVFNFTHGGWTDNWEFCRYGNFPSIASFGENSLVAWVGSEALPIDLQGEGKEPAKQNFMIESRLAMQQQLQFSDKDLKNISEMEKIWGTPYLDPWATLWIGVLNDRGQCIKTYGPLGEGLDRNFMPRLSSANGRAALLWRSTDRHSLEEKESCLIKARLISWG